MHNRDFASLDTVMSKPFRKIALAVDFGINDKEIIAYALQLAEVDTHFTLIHIVESASAKAIGEETRDYETQEDQKIMEYYLSLFAQKGFIAEGKIGFKNRVRAIAKIVKEEQADLLIVGSHGHHSLLDIIFGETVNSLRHKVKIPVFIAQ